MQFLQELLKLAEDAATAGKVRNLRTQLEQVNAQMDAKQQSGVKIDDADPLKKKATALQQQIDELNGVVAEEVEVVAEARNHMGEVEYTTYSTWKKACKKAEPSVWFDGDQDICNAMVGAKPYKRGETRAIGEWDGVVGSLHHHPKAKEATDEAKPKEKLKIKKD